MYDLKKDNEFILTKIESLLVEHLGEYVLVHNCEICGFSKLDKML